MTRAAAHRRRLGLGSVAAGALLLSLGCKPAPPASKPLASLTAQELRGHTSYQAYCAGCHYANSEASLHAPGLQGLYHKRYLPSGAPANDDRISAVIEHGRGMMPALGNALDEQQLGDLLAYLRTL